MLIGAKEAAKQLGVKPASLYSYVSRGLLRSVVGNDKRERRYYVEDVERLKKLRRTRRRFNAPPKPFDNLAPVLDTSLCHVANGTFYYRGIDATQFSETADLEETARLLWPSDRREPFSLADITASLRKALRRIDPSAPIFSRAQALLVAIAPDDLGALDTSRQSTIRTASRLVPIIATSVMGTVANSKPMHVQLANAWKVDEAGTDLIRRCLVLYAEHELNASTYVARCIASTGASPYAAISGAIACLSGPMHGGEAVILEPFIKRFMAARDRRDFLTEFLQTGRQVPGFGHALYPNGDPRAAHILGALHRSKYSRRAKRILTVGDEISYILGKPLNVDFALCAVSAVLNLPASAAPSMFLIGRTVGWLAHIIEQYEDGSVIRPRARYVGTMPAKEG